MTVLQDIRTDASKRWPEERKWFDRASLARARIDLESKVFLHAAEGEVMLMVSDKPLGAWKKHTGYRVWSVRSQMWVWVNSSEIQLLDDDAHEIS